MAKTSILPFFLPMQGCSGRCIYCDQRAISGQSAPPQPAEITAALEQLDPGHPAELAYYGGSFTCLPRETQRRYLDLAALALADGRLCGVRISTRPDAVDDDICRWLAEKGVVTVELGVQSFDDRVLAAAGREYDGAQAREAAAAVRRAGLTLGIQLMTGLPHDTPELDLESMRQALACGPQLLRIYPTLVLKNTELERLYREGLYRPQSLDEAVACCVPLLKAAQKAGVTMQRMGVNPSPSLEAALVAGPYHPAFGALVREALKKEQLQELLQDAGCDEALILRFPPADTPLIFGHQRSTMLWLSRNWPRIALLPDPTLPAGAVVVDRSNE